MFEKINIKYEYLLKKYFNDGDFQKSVEYANYILNFDDCNLNALYYKTIWIDLFFILFLLFFIYLIFLFFNIFIHYYFYFNYFKINFYLF